MGGKQLLDPRWFWLQSALRKLYAEMDDDAVPASLTLITANGDDLVSYSLAPDIQGIECRVIVNPSALTEAAEITTVDASVTNNA